MKNILVIGSGLTGATLAKKHKDNGDRVTVIEKRDHFGGNIYTENIDGICVHKYGAHIFHTSDKEVWDFVNQFVHFNNYRHQVKTRYNDKLYSLPINMNTFNEFFNISNPDDIKQEHIDKIHEALFHGYSSKQWGKPINEINKDVFKRLPFRKTFNNDYFDDTYQGIPIEGYTSLIESLLLGTKRKTGIKVTKDFDFSTYDIIYNTGPIDEFFNYELGKLEYRSLEFQTKKLVKKYHQDFAVINEANYGVKYTRTIEHKHFNDTNKNYTIVTKEYPRPYNGDNEPYYTINDDKNNILYEKYKELAKERFPNMVFCGRLGAYKYYDMDDAIREALNIFSKQKEQL